MRVWVRLRWPLAAAVLLAGLAGCGTPVSDEMRQNPAFQDGYRDGCATAGTRTPGLPGGVIRDDGKFASDRAYKAGWRSGYNACGGARE